MPRDDSPYDHSRPTEHYWLVQRIAYAIAERGGKDGFLQARAEGMVRKSGLLEHLRTGGTYVDVGSGFGHITEKLAMAANGQTRWLGIDPAVRASRKVRARLERDAPGRVSFVRGLGEMLPLRDQSVDGTALFFVLHHVPPRLQARVLEEVGRVTRPGGLAFLIEDTPGTEEERARVVHWDRRVNYESRRAEHHYRSVVEWETLAKDLGLLLLARVDFNDISPKRTEGVIPHSNVVLRVPG